MHKPITKFNCAEEMNNFQHFIILIKFVIVLAKAFPQS